MRRGAALVVGGLALTGAVGNHNHGSAVVFDLWIWSVDSMTVR